MRTLTRLRPRRLRERPLLAALCGCLIGLIGTGTAFAQGGKPLQWPQTFSLQTPALQTLGFPVTQPGPIAVDLQVQGAAVLATLQGPAGEVGRQQGTGSLHLAYAATAQDVGKSVFWVVTVGLVQAPTAAQVATAKVTVNVQHPPIDATRLQAAMATAATTGQGAQAQRRASAAQHSAELTAQLNGMLQQEKAQQEQQRLQRHAALMTQMQPTVDKLRAGSAFGTRAVLPPGMKRLPTSPPPPSIQNLSATDLHVSDPVFVNGSGFGTAGGTVHFVIGVGKDLAADPTTVVWTDAQIFTAVPGPANGGVVDFNGTAYVVRADQVKSNLIPIAFHALLDYRLLTVSSNTGDAILSPNSGGVWGPGFTRDDFDCFSGHTGNDQFYLNTHLKNGWKVYGAPIMQNAYIFGGGGGAVPVGFRIMTDSPYVNIVWWVNVGAFCTSGYGYTVSLPIEGPLGLPDGLVVQ